MQLSAATMTTTVTTTVTTTKEVGASVVVGGGGASAVCESPQREPNHCTGRRRPSRDPRRRSLPLVSTY